MPESTWRPIPGYGDLYEASSEGKVRRKDKGRVLEGGVGKHGYSLVTLTKGGKGTTFNVHDLVTKAFGGSHPGREVNHADGNKTNASLRNLKVVSREENLKHSVMNDLAKRRAK